MAWKSPLAPAEKKGRKLAPTVSADRLAKAASPAAITIAKTASLPTFSQWPAPPPGLRANLSE